MKIDKSTCWYSESYVYSNMINSIKKHLPLNEIGHGKSLIELLNIVDSYEMKVLDIGCGGSLVHSIVKGTYTGADMEHIIENVSKKCFDNLNYISVDVINDDLSFLKNYDIIITNALIDVMQYPLDVLEKILKYSKDYVIIHRQRIINDETKVIKNPSYGGFTYHSIININDFISILDKMNYKVIKNIHSNIDDFSWRSMLLKKIK